MKCEICNKEIINGYKNHFKSCENIHKNKDNIIKLYCNDFLTIKEISKIFKTSEIKIAEVLKYKKRLNISIYENIELENSIILLRNSGYTYNEIKNELNCSIDAIQFYCNKNKLNYQTFPFKISQDIINEMQKYYDNCKSCIKVANKFNLHKQTVLKYIITDKSILNTKIKSDKTKAVIEWRKRTKIKAIEYKGGKCCECGYNKNYTALCFHHLDSNEKDFGISGKCLAWNTIKKELDKCILLCLNCHAELHDKLNNKYKNINGGNISSVEC